MDRQLTNKEIRNERRKKLLRTGMPAVAVIALAAWGISALGVKSVKASSLSFSGVDKGDIDVSISASGRIVPAYEEIIISPIDSRILSVRHTAGDIVEAGEPLLTLDLQAAGIAAQKLSDQLRMKKLELEQLLVGDNTALAKLEMEIKVRKMNVQKLEAELRNERYLDSLGSGTTDKVREAEFALKSGRLELEQLSLQLENEREARRAAADVKRLDIEIMSKEAAMAERTLADAEIRAPHAGTVTQINSEIGSTIGNGQQLAVLADLGHYKVEAEAADSHAKNINPGMRAKVRVGSQTASGIIASVVPASTGGVIKFTVRLDNDSISFLRAGLRPEVSVSNGLKTDVVRIANGSYYREPGKYSLFVRSDKSTLELREVELGAANMDSVEVIRGLRPGESVVTDDMSRYVKNKTLKIK